MDNIIKKSYDLILNDSNFVKLTMLTLLPYSFLFVWYLFYQTYFVIHSLQSWFHLYDLKLYVDIFFKFSQHFFWLVFIVFFLVIIFYVFIPPIGESVLIMYLDKKKWIWNSIGSWILKFFPMFELHWFVSLFSFLFFFIVVSRLYIVDMLDNFFVLTGISIWLIFLIFFNFTLFYAKFLVVLDDYSTFDAIKHSIKLTFLNFSKTFRYFRLYLLLYIRFIINVIIIVWIPIVVLYIFLKFDISNSNLVRYSVFTIMWILFLLTSYINWIVEAFFISVWYNVFKNIDDVEKKD